MQRTHERLHQKTQAFSCEESEGVCTKTVRGMGMSKADVLFDVTTEVGKTPGTVTTPSFVLVESLREEPTRAAPCEDKKLKELVAYKGKLKPRKNRGC